MLIFVLLTVLTQVGGVIYALTESIFSRLKAGGLAPRFLGFCAVYLFSTFIIIPVIAKPLGRVPIENTGRIHPGNYLTLLFNRNYVVPELNEVLEAVSISLEAAKSPIYIRYLDANFPFINKFPLLPHLSHNDGRKLDLSLVYENAGGEIVDQQPSRSGYGIFEEPRVNEVNTTQFCKDKGYFQYDYPKYLTLGERTHGLGFSQLGTKVLLERVLKHASIEKVFLEPHLVKRMGTQSDKIRFQGCRAVRHDDHMHIQVK